MSWIRRLLSSPRARRGLAASAVALAVGGLVLMRAPAVGSAFQFGALDGENGATFQGPGAQGSLRLSQSRVLSGHGESVYAELTVEADDLPATAERAPLSLAIVFDTSGSMSGEKIERSKRSVADLIERMRNEDEVAFVRYDSNHEVVQRLARVGTVRQQLLQRVAAISAGGGTNIPPALDRGIDEVSRAAPGRVRRVILVSDGLDSSRDRAEQLAREGASSSTTISALGIGLDFDESYMSGVANAGRGNFGFVENAGALARFLTQELDETANTVVDDARAHLTLAPGLRFVRAVGAEVVRQEGDEVTLALGSLFSRDQRRVIVELRAEAEHGEALGLSSRLSWRRVGGQKAQAHVPALTLKGERSEQLVLASRNPRVIASATSALASLRQLAATQAYAEGDTDKAEALMDQSLAALETAAAGAPAEEKESLDKQRAELDGAKRAFRAAPPKSAAAKSAGKASAAANAKNIGRKAF
jgi:Ca-activated chloride channel family protein